MSIGRVGAGRRRTAAVHRSVPGRRTALLPTPRSDRPADSGWLTNRPTMPLSGLRPTMPLTARVGPRSPTATVERPGAGVKGSLRRFAPLTPEPVRSKTPHLRGSVAESGRGICSARLRGGRDVALHVRHRRAQDFVPCHPRGRRPSPGQRRRPARHQVPALPTHYPRSRSGTPATGPGRRAGRHGPTAAGAHANTPSSPHPRQTQTSPLRTSRISQEPVGRGHHVQQHRPATGRGGELPPPNQRSPSDPQLVHSRRNICARDQSVNLH